MSVESAESERRFPRRFLIAASGAAVATGAVQAITSPASAADGSHALEAGRQRRRQWGRVQLHRPAQRRSTDLQDQTGHRRAHRTDADRAERPRQCRRPEPRPPSSASGPPRPPLPRAPARMPRRAPPACRAQQTAVPGVRGNSVDNYGVYGTGGYTGVRCQGGTYGSISSGSSVGAYGSGSDYGVYGSGGSYGVYGGGSTYGVYGSGPTGVLGSGSTYGVSGTTYEPEQRRGARQRRPVRRARRQRAHCRHARRLRLRRRLGPGDHVRRLRRSPPTASAQSYGVFGQASNGGVVSPCRPRATCTSPAPCRRPRGPSRSTTRSTRLASGSRTRSSSRPDMMNVYNGNAVLDARGEATVRLPDYFGALNRDFRYQLTPIGAHAPVYVAREVKDNSVPDRRRTRPDSRCPGR